MKPVLYIVVPCYNEQEVLPITAPLFLQKLETLRDLGKISGESRVLFVNDGSRDGTWEIICALAASDPRYLGISQSRNRGHQNAVLAGLMEAKDRCDITISIDCDGQDDIDAMDRMVDAYLDGCDVVYGVRASRRTDSFFKRFTAQSFYRFLAAMGAEVVYNHADYRLISARVLREFRGGRHHQPLRQAPAAHHRLRRDRGAGELHWGPVGARHGPVRQERGRLGEHDLYRLFCLRRTADLPRHHRRVYRQDLSGNQTAPPLYHLRAHLGELRRRMRRLRRRGSENSRIRRRAAYGGA